MLGREADGEGEGEERESVREKERKEGGRNKYQCVNIIRLKCTKRTFEWREKIVKQLTASWQSWR